MLSLANYILIRYGCGAAREFINPDGTFHPIQKMKCQWNREWFPAINKLPVSIIFRGCDSANYFHLNFWYFSRVMLVITKGKWERRGKGSNCCWEILELFVRILFPCPWIQQSDWIRFQNNVYVFVLKWHRKTWHWKFMLGLWMGCLPAASRTTRRDKSCAFGLARRGRTFWWFSKV